MTEFQVFSAAPFIIAWKALKEFVQNGGKMRLVCSPYISDPDEAALSQAYSARNNQLLADSIKEEVEALFQIDVQCYSDGSYSSQDYSISWNTRW